MPTYQYRCTECRSELEAVQKFTDSALTECPTCGGGLRKVFNAVGVVFKGSGFYRTDSRAHAGAAAQKDATQSDSGSGNGSSDSSSEGSAEKSGEKSTGPAEKVAAQSPSKQSPSKQSPSNEATTSGKQPAGASSASSQ